MPTRAFTIRKLADTAGVGVEAIRYYQRRGLMTGPERFVGSFREYSDNDVLRLRFIKRAQDLGFSLDDIAELASLSGAKNKARVRALARLRAAEIRERVGQLESVASALENLVECCETSAAGEPCPIIAALVNDAPSTRPATEGQSSRRLAGSNGPR